MAYGSDASPANGALIALNSTAAAFPPEITAPARMLGDEVAAARSYRAQAKAANTLRDYTSDWNQFEGWCDERGLEPLPARPEAVATYLAARAMAGKADTTIGRHLAAIGWKHGQDGSSHRSNAMNACSLLIRWPDPPGATRSAQCQEGGYFRQRTVRDDRGRRWARHAF